MNSAFFVRRESEKDCNNISSRIASNVIRPRLDKRNVKNMVPRNATKPVLRQSNNKDIEKIRTRNNASNAVFRRSHGRVMDNMEPKHYPTPIFRQSYYKDLNNIQPKNNAPSEVCRCSQGRVTDNIEPRNVTKVENIDPRNATKVENTDPRNALSIIYRSSGNKEFKNKPSRRNRETEIVKISEEIQNMNNKIKLTDTFHSILRYGMVLGLPLSHTLLSMKNDNFGSNWVKILLNFWITLTTALNTVCTAVMCIYIKYFFASTANRSAYLAHCSCGLALSWIFVLQRRKIKRALRHICHVASEFPSDIVDTKPPIKVYLVLIGVHATLTTCINVKFLFYDNWDSSIKNVKKNIPFQEGSAFYSCYIWFATFSMAYPVLLGTLIDYFALLLCGEAYRSLGLLISLYGNEFQNSVIRGSFKTMTATECIAQFKRVFSCVQIIDETFGVFSSIIYVDVFFLVFGSVSIYLSGDIRFQTFDVLAFGVLLMTLGFVMLIYLAYSGDKVMREGEKLKKKLIGISYLLFKQSPDVSTLVMFNLLSNEIKEKKYNVTLLGFFDINKRFVLSVVGLLISYNATLYQLGTIANS